MPRRERFSFDRELLISFTGATMVLAVFYLVSYIFLAITYGSPSLLVVHTEFFSLLILFIYFLTLVRFLIILIQEIELEYWPNRFYLVELNKISQINKVNKVIDFSILIFIDWIHWDEENLKVIQKY